MTGHELARQLLDLPDLPLALRVEAGGDSVTADPGDAKAEVGTYTRDDDEEENSVDVIQIRGWATDTPLMVNWP